MDIDSEEIVESLSSAVDALRRGLLAGVDGDSPVFASDAPLARSVCSELLIRVSTVPKSVIAMKDTCEILLAAGADPRMIQVICLRT